VVDALFSFPLDQSTFHRCATRNLCFRANPLCLNGVPSLDSFSIPDCLSDPIIVGDAYLIVPPISQRASPRMLSDSNWCVSSASLPFVVPSASSLRDTEVPEQSSMCLSHRFLLFLVRGRWKRPLLFCFFRGSSVGGVTEHFLPSATNSPSSLCLLCNLFLALGLIPDGDLTFPARPLFSSINPPC